MLSKICNAIKRLLRREDKFVGRDENGNSYYESSKGKRWVMYSSVSEPTTVPPQWHIWLHYTDNVVPVNNKKRKVKHTPNLTGVGDSVKISGVDVGSITGVSLDKATYVARIDMCISKDIKLPIDSSALITSSGVVGSKFVNISPGSDIKLILHGGKIEYTQAEANMGGIMDRILGMFTK
ncbi:mlaD domain-containing protein [Nephila pilipes]|uniref:NADH dehydrogenase [ubiquinone] 1 alpha subcomplex subunit 12 n=1 Tax=Nephila pilipes TaxID=299642 RepID=A0A8X6U7A0_NEPPI|nr:mlaD domain-containing protein [Nephila pilipes]